MKKMICYNTKTCDDFDCSHKTPHKKDKDCKTICDYKINSICSETKVKTRYEMINEM